MRSQKQRQNDEGRDHRYNPPRFRIEEAREALGLPDDSTGQQASQALKQLLENTAALPAAMKLSGAHEAVTRAFIPGKPDLFGPAAELEAQNPEKLREVLQAIRDLRSGLERFQAFPRYCSEEMPGTPASSSPAAELSQHSLPKRTPSASPAPSLSFGSATAFLAEARFIGPEARPDIPPLHEHTARVRKLHGIEWRWNEESLSWDPRKKNSPQNLFRAGRPYFDDVLRQVATGAAQDLSGPAIALVRSCARLCEEIPRPLTPGVAIPEHVAAQQRLAFFAFLVAAGLAR